MFVTTAIRASGNNCVAPCPACGELLIFARLKEYYTDGTTTATPAKCGGCGGITYANRVKIPADCWQPLISTTPSARAISDAFRAAVTAAHGGAK